MQKNSFLLFGARGTGKSTLLKVRFQDIPYLYLDLLQPEVEDEFEAVRCLDTLWGAEVPKKRFAVCPEENSTYVVESGCETPEGPINSSGCVIKPFAETLNDRVAIPLDTRQKLWMDWALKVEYPRGPKKLQQCFAEGAQGIIRVAIRDYLSTGVALSGNDAKIATVVMSAEAAAKDQLAHGPYRIGLSPDGQRPVLLLGGAGKQLRSEPLSTTCPATITNFEITKWWLSR